MKIYNIYDELKSNSYPGRGIITGESPDAKSAVIAYFIMGRSENSRNRVFVETENGGLRTEAYDPDKLTDPHLVIYSPVRMADDKRTVVTNGDQTDTICDRMSDGETFEESLRTREFEDDAPNYTPRISSITDVSDGKARYTLSILKSNNGDPSSCQRFTYDYTPAQPGEGHFIHTYMGDGSPLPSFEGEPKRITGIPDTADEFAEKLWSAFNEDNKISLFVRYIDIKSGRYDTRIVNKNK